MNLSLSKKKTLGMELALINLQQTTNLIPPSILNQDFSNQWEASSSNPKLDLILALCLSVNLNIKCRPTTKEVCNQVSSHNSSNSTIKCQTLSKVLLFNSKCLALGLDSTTSNLNQCNSILKDSSKVECREINLSSATTLEWVSNLTEEDLVSCEQLINHSFLIFKVTLEFKF